MSLVGAGLRAVGVVVSPVIRMAGIGVGMCEDAVRLGGQQGCNCLFVPVLLCFRVKLNLS